MSVQHGKCKLCGIEGVLLNGHIAAKFGYKRWITSAGGRYFDSERDQYATKQPTLYMFCPQCENIILGQLDDFGARLLSRFQKAPLLPHVYDERLLPWAVSLSFRALLSSFHQCPERKQAAISAMERWKSVLLGQERSVGPFTQHGFLRYFEGESRFQKVLEWDYLPEDGLAFFKFGPLVIFGVTSEMRWSKEDKRAADASMIKHGGGYIQAFGDYEAGVNIPSIMKAVSDERNIRILESVVSSKRRAREFLEQVPELTRLEVFARIRDHRRTK